MLGDVLESPLDRQNVTHCLKVSELGFELIGHEVITSTGAPVGIGQNVYRANTVSRKLEGRSRCQAINLRNKEVAF